MTLARSACLADVAIETNKLRKEYGAKVAVADLTLEDGSVARAVRFAAFRFLDQPKLRK